MSPFPSHSISQPNTTSSTRTYYDLPHVNDFYTSIWGGDYISIGIYTSPTDSIIPASHNTVLRLASLASPLTSRTRILDLGSGYGGSARYLAKTYGCHVTCLNLSPTQNSRNRDLCKEEGLEGLVDVIEGTFEDVPLPDHAYDVIWSQDAFLHSGDREKVVSEIDRLLVSQGGKVVFSDILQSANVADPKALESYMQRLPVDELATEEFYLSRMKEKGFGDGSFEDLTEQLAMHYGKVRDEFVKHEVEFLEQAQDQEEARAFLERSKAGLESAVSLATERILGWGIFVFQR